MVGGSKLIPYRFALAVLCPNKKEVSVKYNTKHIVELPDRVSPLQLKKKLGLPDRVSPSQLKKKNLGFQIEFLPRS